MKECIIKAEQMALEGKTFIHPFDDPDIIVGQGTMGLEILEDLKETDMILVPIGGGIISGIASTGAGAVSMAALLNGSVTVPRGSRVVLLISGGNVDSSLLGRILSQGLLKNDRIMRIRVRLTDAPGSLVQLLALISAVLRQMFYMFIMTVVHGICPFTLHESIWNSKHGIPNTLRK